MLNEQQQLACDSTAKKILCLAAAGSGKTYTMLERVTRLIRDGADPLSILVLTFTNAAAFNMSTRFRQNSDSKIIPEFRTFHGFCYSLLAGNPSVRKALGFNKIPTIVEENNTKNIHRKAKSITGVSLSEKKLRDYSLCTTEVEQFEYDVYHKEVYKMLKAENVITFDRLCYGVCELFANNDPCVDRYKKQYKYIFVDEFQDTDSKQWEFVQTFKDADIFVVGDALQAIYGFRGANSDIIKELAVDPEWKTIRMSQNYRSTAQICDYANANSRYADPSYRIELESDRDGSKVDHVLVPSGKQSYSEPVPNSMLNDITERVNSYSGLTAVLCRTNMECEAVTNHLQDNGIAVTTSNSQEFVHILNSAKDNDYFFNWLLASLSSKLYMTYIRDASLDKPENELEYIINKFGHLVTISRKVDKVKLFRLTCKSKEETHEQKVAHLFSILGWNPETVDADAEFHSISDILTYVQERANKVLNEGVYVGTIHSSKGLEYDNVILVNVDGKSFPLKDEEQCNLYYVGITRAKHNLTVYKVVA